MPADSEATPPAPTAAIMLVGNELLSGKIRDSNGYFLAQCLRRRGVRLTEICVVEDTVDVIAASLRRLLQRASIVFTSGGVGPTHDDVTLEGIAMGTDRPLERHEGLERQLRRHFGSDITDQALSMADVPRGTELRAQQGWPVLRLDLDDPPDARIYILPGVPDLLRMKVEALEAAPGELPEGEGWHLLRLSTTLDESALAEHLDVLVQEFATVEIGSYPKWRPDGEGRLRAHVQVTFEAPREHADAAERARDALRASLPSDAVLDHDPA